jgi:hypothetical protein
MDVDAEQEALFHEVYEGVTIIRPQTYAKAQVVDLDGLIPVCHKTNVS